MDETPPSYPQTKFSMLKAAEAIGVSQSTMHRYIKAGRVSAKKLDTGGYEIDASELFRAFPPGWSKKGSATHSETLIRDDAEPAGTPSETSNETGALRAEVKMLREMLERADLDLERERRAASDAIDDYRRRLDDESRERRALNVQLLAYQKPPEPANPQPPAAPNEPQRRGLFGMFRRAG